MLVSQPRPQVRTIHLKIARMTSRYIYHITHIRNLPGILKEGGLLPDAEVRRREINIQNIGYSHIKDRRMRRPIRAGMEGTLGQYVPFNFCSRSVMLYALRNGHADYEGGQDQILHLVSSVDSVVRTGRPYVFTDIHADLDYAQHFDDLNKLEESVDWAVMNERYWSDPEVKKRRQAEFLVWEFFPWEAVLGIATKTQVVADEVSHILKQAEHKPKVLVKSGWYY